MEKQHIEWDKLGFGYLETSASYEIGRAHV